MPRPHYKTAPPNITRQFEIARRNSDTQFGTVQAAGQLAMIDACTRLGYVITEADLDLHYSLAHDAALKVGQHSEANRIQQEHGAELEYEKRCLARVRGLAGWAQQDIDAERQAAEAKQAAEAFERAIIARAKEIIADENKQRRDRALAQARRELSKGRAA